MTAVTPREETAPAGRFTFPWGAAGDVMKRYWRAPWRPIALLLALAWLIALATCALPALSG